MTRAKKRLTAHFLWHPDHPSAVPIPQGYREVCDLVVAMRAGLVRPFSWDEWQELLGTFTHWLRVAMSVNVDVARRQAGKKG